MVADLHRKSKPPKRAVRQGEIPLLSRVKARNLYLVQGLPHKAISEVTGLKVQTLMSLASREGWTNLRRAAKKRAEEKSQAQECAVEQEILDSVVALSSQHAISGLNRTGEALERSDQFAARDFQSYTSGVKNLVSIMREIRAPQEQQPSGSTLNMFVIRVGDAAAPAQQLPKLEQPCVEVAATPAP